MLYIYIYYTPQTDGGFLEWEYPEIIQVMDDHVSIETHGDLGSS